MAKTDFKLALPVARKVSDPWFRCQALANAARYAPDDQVVGVAEEAIAAALMATDSYQRVAATAWPLRALIERVQEVKAHQYLPRILELSGQIENPISRSDALFLLWQAFFPTEGHRSVLGALVRSCASCAGHWKSGYLLRDTALILASVDKEAADGLVAAMEEGKYKRSAQKRLSEDQQGQARPFFF